MISHRQASVYLRLAIVNVNTQWMYTYICNDIWKNMSEPFWRQFQWTYNKSIHMVPILAVGGPHTGHLADEFICYMPYWINTSVFYKMLNFFLYPRPTKLEGGYTGFTLSVRLSVRPSVCRRHGFRSIRQVSFGISISNFICVLMVVIGRSLLIFSDVTFKMAAWRPYWIFWFPDSNFTLALNINFKLQRHNTYVYG